MVVRDATMDADFMDAFDPLSGSMSEVRIRRRWTGPDAGQELHAAIGRLDLLGGVATP